MQTIIDEEKYEVPLKSSVMNDFSCSRTWYVSRILCIHIMYPIIHLPVKFRRNRTNINIAIDIQSRRSRIHWPIFEDEKVEVIKEEIFIFNKSGVALKSLLPKGDVEQTLQYNT